MWKPGFSFVFNLSLDDYDGECIPAARNYAGSGFVLQLYIGLDNGKGQRYIDGDPTKPDEDFLPLETFNVQRNQYYKFRTINVGFLAAFEISVDDAIYPAGMNFVSIPLTNMRSTLGAIMKNAVPIVKRREQTQLFFLNFNVKLGFGPNINGRRFVKPTSALQT